MGRLNKRQRAQSWQARQAKNEADEPTSAPPEQPVLAPAAAPCLGVDFAKCTVHLGDLRRPDGSPTFEEFTVSGGDVTRGRSAAW
jgi:hypothetical protein